MKTKTRILSFVLCMVMLLSLCPAVTPAEAAAADTQTYSSTVTISNFAELKSALATAKTNTRYVLTADIDCGGATLGKIFCLGSGSVLDGDGHAILNFNTKDTNDTEGRSGVFKLADTGTITFRNLTFGSPEAPLKISNCLVSRSAGVAGDPEESIWENVNAYVDLTRTSGGFLGVFYGQTQGKHTFTNCHVTVKTTATDSLVGGFIARYIGESLTLEGCTVNGNMSLSVTSGRFPIGGFIGQLDENGDGSMKVVISNCTNNAKISLSSAVADKETGCGGYIGIIASAWQYFDIDLTVSRCKNTGNISGNKSTGGFIGYIRLYDPNINLISCVNEGNVDGMNNKNASVGGFVGCGVSINSVRLNRCINKGTISGGGICGGLVGYAARGYYHIVESYNKGSVNGVNGAKNIGGLVGLSGESLRVERSMNVGALSKRGNRTDTMAQIVSGASGTLVITDCYGFGQMLASATNCGAIVTNLPLVYEVRNNLYLASDHINKFYGVDKQTDGRTNLEADAILTQWTVTGDNEEICIAPPAIKGVQETDVYDYKTTIRLLASVDTKNYRAAGMNVQITVGGTVLRPAEDISCTQLYESILEINPRNGKPDTVSADSPIFSGNYIMSVSLSGIPTNQGPIEIIATPYAIDQNGVRHNGRTVGVTYTYRDNFRGIESVDFHTQDTKALFERVFSGVLPAYLDGKASTNSYAYSLLVGARQASPDDYTMISVTGTTSTAFEAYIADLKTAGFSVWDAGDAIKGISGYWVEKDGVRAYLYCAEKSGVARFILDKSEKQTMSHTISDSYVKKAGDTVNFYMYGVDMLGNTGGTSLIAVIKLADNSLILIDGATQQQLSGAAGVHLNEFLHTITGTPAGGKITVKAWVITHHHVDHGPGLVQFFTDHHSQYDLQYMMGNMANMRDYYIDFVSTSKAYRYFPNLKLHRLHTGETIKLGGVEMDILYTLEDLVIPEAGTIATSDDNDFSVQYRFRFDGIKVHMTGDISLGGERAMLKMYEKSDMKVDIFQSPHHGYNNTVRLFEVANPSVTVFSAPKSVAQTKVPEVYENLVKNTIGGEANCYFEGDETIGFSVVNGKITVIYREATFVG